jgi:hypothetical protein
MKCGALRITGAYAPGSRLRGIRKPYGGLAYENRSRGCAPLRERTLVRFLRHIWGGGQCYALPYYPPQTSHTTGTLYAMGAKMNRKYIDMKIK